MLTGAIQDISVKLFMLSSDHATELRSAKARIAELEGACAVHKSEVNINLFLSRCLHCYYLICYLLDISSVAAVAQLLSLLIIYS